ncbi:MAG: hypothetical protein H6Q14_112 [Bacteroidetes bacterium]|nr:hypothetical protein [Bacteroidota bacterium]
MFLDVIPAALTEQSIDSSVIGIPFIVELSTSRNSSIDVAVRVWVNTVEAGI